MLPHGLPDNRHRYDRLVPSLRRWVVAFDFLGWEDPTSPPATRTRPATRSSTSTPSSCTCSSARWCWWPTTPPTTGDRLGSGPSRTGVCAGATEHLLLPDARAAPPAGGDLAVLDPYRPSGRPPGLDVAQRAVFATCTSGRWGVSSVTRRTELLPGQATEPHRHAGQETGYVLRGRWTSGSPVSATTPRASRSRWATGSTYGRALSIAIKLGAMGRANSCSASRPLTSLTRQGAHRRRPSRADG